MCRDLGAGNCVLRFLVLVWAVRSLPDANLSNCDFACLPFALNFCGGANTSPDACASTTYRGTDQGSGGDAVSRPCFADREARRRSCGAHDAGRESVATYRPGCGDSSTGCAGLQ